MCLWSRCGVVYLQSQNLGDGDRRIKSSRSSRFHDPKKESFSIVPMNIQIFNLTTSDGSHVPMARKI